MRSFLHISPDETPPKGGGGPDVNDEITSQKLRSHGFMTLAFGVALGLTFMIIFGLFRLIGAPSAGLTAYDSENSNLWLSFLYGFVGGLFISIFYNMLVFRKLKIFGMERHLD